MSGEKTEQPTHKKLMDARKKGQVAYSKDFTQTILILAMFGYMIGGAQGIVESIGRLMLLPMDFIHQPFQASLDAVLLPLMKDGITVLLPFVLIVLGIGIFADALQVGIMFAFEAVKPSAKKLNALANAKNMVSKKNMVEFLKNCIKVGFLTALLFIVLRDEIPRLLTLPLAGIVGVGTAIGSLLYVVIVNVAMVYVVLALADFVWQRFNHKKQLMMSKDEVKREYKEAEGDPHIKGARKQLHQEMMMSGMVEKTRKASVVVTNPTHVAIALYYDEDKTPLPVVLAKGTDLVAKRIVAVAREEGIPVMENVPLARALLEQAQLDQYIPSDLLEPVAEVLRLVGQLAEGKLPGEPQ
ncbi:type III secretion system export apparatus subunit SctU [Pseudothauera rhizosphaerae]|uniref:EscU/YscU/HrcU family type III secretion system export apparatus switch protein n=1 Tax=Pseudothauera rhizosphaerae TaxID=2565932 RepID=A0A4S4AET9_9RHOO|nr:type III secretion system export apparatus subunit SctU [Pseudothauera rhizosphaerae]THF57261.1 EscU/YscU/HrcU family type III secretion system export apparatus switch protein [Pseudothauera rhizosphaerae]